MNDGTLLTPLSIILAFIGVIEATLAYRVTSLDGTAQMIFVWFMVTFPAAVLAGFFYIQITAPLSWYPPSELNKTSKEHLQFLDKTSQKLISVEMLDTANLTQSKTIGGTPLTSQAIELYRKGDYQQALELFEKAITLETHNTLPSSIRTKDVAQTQTNIGATLSSLGRYDEALVAFQRALELYQQSGDESSIGVLLNNIGSVYKNMGRFEDAVEAYQRSLEISNKLYGSDHPDTAITINNLGSVYAAMGDYDRSLALFQQSLSVYEKILGPEHPQTATSLNNLASMYQSMGNMEQALPLYQRALSINEKLLGKEHPSTKLIRDNIERLKEKK